MPPEASLTTSGSATVKHSSSHSLGEVGHQRPSASVSEAAVVVSVGVGDALGDALGVADGDGVAVVESDVDGDVVAAGDSSSLVVSHHATMPAAMTSTIAMAVMIAPRRDFFSLGGSTCTGSVIANPLVGAPRARWREITRSGPDAMVGSCPHVTVSVPVRWGDLDAYGHVNNVAVMALLEQARVQAFWDPGAPVLPPLAAGSPVQVVVADAHVSYRLAIPYVQAVDVAVTVPRVGGASFVIGYEIIVEGEVAVSATTTLALVDVATWRPLRLDSAQRERLAAFAPVASTPPMP